MMPGLNRRSSPVEVSAAPSLPKSSGHIKFAEKLVTGVSRRVSKSEERKLYEFEFHAATKTCCRNPRALAKAGKQLCEDGKCLANQVAELRFKIRDGDKVFYRPAEGQEERVEVPDKYNNVISLLWAIRDFGRGIIKPKQVSYDRTYPSAPRPTSQKYSFRYTEGPIITYSTRNVELLSPRGHKTVRLIPSRGSLYSKDEQARIEDARRERATRYNLEVREPKHRSHYYR